MVEQKAVSLSLVVYPPAKAQNKTLAAIATPSISSHTTHRDRLVGACVQKVVRGDQRTDPVVQAHNFPQQHVAVEIPHADALVRAAEQHPVGTCQRAHGLIVAVECIQQTQRIDIKDLGRKGGGGKQRGEKQQKKSFVKYTPPSNSATRSLNF